MAGNIAITRKLREFKDQFIESMLTKKDFEALIDELSECEKAPSVRAEICDMFKQINVNCDSEMNSSYYDNLLKNNEEVILNREDNNPDVKAFRTAIGRLSAIEKMDSRRHSICAGICNMFKRIGIRCERGKEADYYRDLLESSASKIHEVKDIEGHILKFMYDKFEEYLTPEEYMLRIVDRLTKEEDAGWKNDTLRVRILKQFIKYGNFLAYTVSRIDNNGKESNKKISVYNGEKEIIKYVKQKTKESPANIAAIIKNIDDSIFKLLDGASKDQKKYDGKFGLLKMADDLAYGRFKAGGATKRDLYMFAFVYNMTFYIPSPNNEVVLDYNKDIEINLFRDYYSNNLMRFITDEYSEERSSYELDPSGQGINYKNFAEMIYIYYLSKNYSPEEKIKRSNEMIERLKNHSEKSKYSSKEKQKNNTEYYRNLYVEEILSKPEEEFETFVLNNFVCSDEDNKKGTLQIQTTQETAYNEYCNLISALELELNPDKEARAAIRKESETASESEKIILGRYSKDMTVMNCNYGLWFTDVSSSGKYEASVNYKGSIKKSLIENGINDSSEKEKEKIKKFIKLLNSINMFLGHNFDEGKSEKNEKEEYTELSVAATKALNVKDSGNITRTSLMVAYYYYYNAHLENIGCSKSFLGVYLDYINTNKGLNSILMKAGYQPVNVKNIFDMAIIFSSFSYLKM